MCGRKVPPAWGAWGCLSDRRISDNYAIITSDMDSIVTMAEYLSYRYWEKSHADIDEMKMHKLLYLAQRESIVRSGNPLFHEGIYAFQYGPVIKEVRTLFRKGGMHVTEFFTTLTERAKDILDSVFETYSGKNSWSLSRLTHAEYSWCHARHVSTRGGGDRLMALEDIRKDAYRIRERRKLRAALVVQG